MKQSDLPKPPPAPYAPWPMPIKYDAPKELAITYNTPASMFRLDTKGQLTAGTCFDEAFSEVQSELAQRLSGALSAPPAVCKKFLRSRTAEQRARVSTSL